MVFDRLRLGRTRGAPDRRPPHLSFGTWADLPEGSVVQVCHPDWRGVKAAAYAFRTPVVECDDLAEWAEELTAEIAGRSVTCVVIQGWPPGAGSFARLLSEKGVDAKAVLHSSPALQGEISSEADVVAEAFELARVGFLTGIGMDKSGVAEGFAAFGHQVTHLPNRASDMTGVTRMELGEGFHVGVFGEPWWPKNILTQVLAVGLLEGSIAHLSRPLGVTYLDDTSHVVHDGLDRQAFLNLLGSVEVNLNVSLTECHPMLPIESYLLGVPCLMSRTSAVFRNDPALWDLTTVSEHDNPSAIAEAARILIRNRGEALERARAWIATADRDAEERWVSFISG